MMNTDNLPLSPATDKKQLLEQLSANASQWQAAIDFLQSNDLSSLALGRHDITPEGTYANVQEYETKAESKYEAHRDYIDLQIVVSGKEYIYVAPLSSVSGLVQAYDKAKDIEFYASASDATAVLADPQNWVVLFPDQAHEPCMTIGSEPSRIRKIVVKIPFVKE